MNSKKELERMLIETGLINEKQLEIAKKEQGQSKESLTKIIISLGLVNENKMIEFLSSKLGITRVNLSRVVGIDLKVADVIPESMAKANLIFPISKRNDLLTLAMADPLNTSVIEKVTKMGYRVKPVISTEVEIKNAIQKYYGKGAIVEDILREAKPLVEEEVIDLEVGKDESPAINLVNHLLIEAINTGASDIHIEPYEQSLWTRYRIDGILHKVSSSSRHFHEAIISRIKIMSGLDITERRRPQDGRAKVRILGQEVDLRVSTTPTIFGEKIVMRILDPSGLCLSLSSLFEPEILNIYNSYIRKPQGFILISGPTGSGKTTTLYSTLAAIRSVEKNIMTVEDPVEYVLGEGVNQQHVKSMIGLDFATSVRSFLRQDPDIILIGEIRDKETADAAITAALTGHLVFSTIHTNSSSEIITRLCNMGIAPYLITSTLIMGIAQRLARAICSKCKESYEANPEIAETLGVEEGTLLYQGKGCKYCNQIGYKGRTGIYEVMVINEAIQTMIIDQEPSHKIEEVAQQNGMITLREAAIKKVLAGITTIEELYRITS
ncbi:TPA: type II secretion system protein GspE [bacterium]|nr:type II secretion system protein GspE [bacterium]